MTHAEMSNAELAHRLREAVRKARAGRVLALLFLVAFWALVIWGLW